MLLYIYQLLAAGIYFEALHNSLTEKLAALDAAPSPFLKWPRSNRVELHQYTNYDAVVGILRGIHPSKEWSCKPDSRS